MTVWAVVETPDGWWERVHSLYATEALAAAALVKLRDELEDYEKWRFCRVEAWDVAGGGDDDVEGTEHDR